jgi:hypothetical protein
MVSSLRSFHIQPLFVFTHTDFFLSNILEIYSYHDGMMIPRSSKLGRTHITSRRIASGIRLAHATPRNRISPPSLMKSKLSPDRGGFGFGNTWSSRASIFSKCQDQSTNTSKFFSEDFDEGKREQDSVFAQPKQTACSVLIKAPTPRSTDKYF